MNQTHQLVPTPYVHCHHDNPEGRFRDVCRVMRNSGMGGGVKEGTSADGGK